MIVLCCCVLLPVCRTELVVITSWIFALARDLWHLTLVEIITWHDCVAVHLHFEARNENMVWNTFNRFPFYARRIGRYGTLLMSKGLWYPSPAGGTLHS